MRQWLLLLLTALLLTGCGEPSWHSKDISGSMPALEFKLTDENGRQVSAKDYLGKPTLLFFGFTHCPDVCPSTLAYLAAVSKQLDGEAREDLQVLFVSVDPARDDPQALRSYTDAFGPQFIGLTGDKAALDALTRRYYSLYEYGAKDAAGNYDVMHSTAVFAFNRKGEARFLFREGDPVDAVTADLRHLSADR
ncbi:SCO1/SenC family protein [Metapseudomonas resinovorans]|uniref:SCO family protein n=1 Tax=Metapseudomonas resinovorans TaxID=53412 RepID=UPI000986B986|nr:SCO family protein [Pseudomonas resinovorans]GLZ87445.1 SCO1/SenC family protein [Pseudomonas resinovorans]